MTQSLIAYIQINRNLGGKLCSYNNKNWNKTSQCIPVFYLTGKQDRIHINLKDRSLEAFLYLQPITLFIALNPWMKKTHYGVTIGKYMMNMALTNFNLQKCRMYKFHL